MHNHQQMHQHLLDLLGAKDHEDAARIIAGQHARELAASQPAAPAHYGPLRDADAEYGKRLQVYASTPAQPAVPQGGAYAELPEEQIVSIYERYGGSMMNCARAIERAVRASHGQAPAGARSADELARDLKNAIDTSLELRQQLRLMEEHVRGEVWRWQPEGSNELATMGNRMGVLIYASDLRNLISAAPTAQPAPAATPQADSAPASVAGPMQFGGCPECGSRTCVARQCSRTVSHAAQAIPGVQWQCGPQASGFTAPQADSQPVLQPEAARVMLNEMDANDRVLAAIDDEAIAESQQAANKEGFWAWWKPYQLPDGWIARVDLVAWHAWQAATIAARATADSVTAPAGGAVAGPSDAQVWAAMQAFHQHDSDSEGMRAALIAGAAAPTPAAQGDAEDAADPLQGAANWLAQAHDQFGTAVLQGCLMIGYNRAKRLHDAALPQKEGK